MCPDTYDPRTHRKLVRHCDEPGHAHELTFSCYHRLPLLSEPKRCILLSEAINRALPRHGFQLVAFVYMPEHLHMVVLPTSQEARIAKLLFAIKRPFSHRVKRTLEEEASPLLGRLNVRERPGRTTFRFWQEGGGYDRNIKNEETLRTAVEYLHNNPVRRGLCTSPDHWKWSSWRYYFEPDDWPVPGLPDVRGFPV